MTVFADALDLRTAVIEHVRNPSIADVFPRLVKMAEVGFNRRLRCRDQIMSEDVIITGGVGYLPPDMLEVIGVFNVAGQEYVQQPLQVVKSPNARGVYAVSQFDLIAPQDETLRVEYYARIPTIGESLTDTNWLLQKAPGLYLYGVGLEAAKYLRDAETAQATIPFLDMEFIGVSAQDATERYSRARVIVQGVTP